MDQNLPTAVTIGEPAGIGPDVILLSWLHSSKIAENRECDPYYVIGDAYLLKKRARLMGLAVPVVVATPGNAKEIFQNALPVVPLDAPFFCGPGAPSRQDSAGIVESINQAVTHVRSGAAQAVVTAPINKKSLYDAGFSHSGHTEYLAELASSWPSQSAATTRPVMMLTGPLLRAVPVTIHIPLKEVANVLNTDDIVEVSTIAARDLISRFGISKPRLAISGLNPHAGEEGTMGKEDGTIIAPAVAALKAAGIDAIGPLPADTMFHDRARATYDVAICMYHDQALIPAKALDFDRTVNVTLGLPFIRTSPDHGTAFDIAGTGKANPTSMISALKLAGELARNDD